MKGEDIMMEEYFKSLADSQKERTEAFAELKAKPRKAIRQGDKVLVAVGLLGHGYVYLREECTVLEVKQNSIKISFRKSYDKEDRIEWCDPCLITDVLVEE